MSMRDLISWGRNGSQSPAVYRNHEQDQFLSLHREMNRLFDDTLRNFGFGQQLASRGGWPSLEVSETDREIRIAAEVPGVESKDVDVLLEDGVLILRGEKRAETEDKERQFSERFYGRFERRIPLAYEVDEDKIDASFKNGILKVTLPKTTNAQSKVKHIVVKG